jgi:hypothetical protein
MVAKASSDQSDDLQDSAKANTMLSTSASEVEVSEDHVDKISPDTCMSKLLELREIEVMRQELWRMMMAERSVNNRKAVGISSTRMMVDQEGQKPPNLEESSDYDDAQEETVLLGKVNQKDSLLVLMEKAVEDDLGPGPCGKKEVVEYGCATV